VFCFLSVRVRFLDYVVCCGMGERKHAGKLEHRAQLTVFAAFLPSATIVVIDFDGNRV